MTMILGAGLAITCLGSSVLCGLGSQQCCVKVKNLNQSANGGLASTRAKIITAQALIALAAIAAFAQICALPLSAYGFIGILIGLQSDAAIATVIAIFCLMNGTAFIMTAFSLVSATRTFFNKSK